VEEDAIKVNLNKDLIPKELMDNKKEVLINKLIY